MVRRLNCCGEIDRENWLVSHTVHGHTLFLSDCWEGSMVVPVTCQVTFHDNASLVNAVGEGKFRLPRPTRWFILTQNQMIDTA